ncbi:MAG: hypothetical protein Q9218_006931 [Villophora microphyllina]
MARSQKGHWCVRQRNQLFSQLMHEEENQLDRFVRVPSDHRRYLEYNAQLKKDHGSVMDYVVKERLRWTDLKPKDAAPFTDPNTTDIKILYNDWPYGIDKRIVHLVVWTKFDLPDDPNTKELALDMRAKIDDYVDRTFCQAVPKDNVIWFKNWKGLKSIHSVEHFHVMLFDPDPKFIEEVTHGDIPLSRKDGFKESLLEGGNTNDGSKAEQAGGEDETVVEPDQGNVLSHIISQLRPGADLSRVVLPTFILEPRSMLERITNFMAHPELLLPLPEVQDPVQRFLSVVKFYLSGWHIKPPGVKKPLNPILGETFTCYWEFPDHTHGYYISEQTSHHPPKSSYFYMAPEHGIRIDGALKPHSKFLGNSAASMMEGVAVLRFMNVGRSRGGERYFLTQPNMYARGILFGKMKYELGDHSYVRCPENGLVADIEFKTKGYFGGTYNAIGGVIRSEKTGETLYELSGMWSGEMVAKHLSTGKKEVLFNATNAKHTPPLVRPLEDQDDRESQKLWYKTVVAIKEQNHEAATDEKTKIEDQQREEAARRQRDGTEWQPKLFRRVRGGPGGSEEGEEDLDWILAANIDGPTPDAMSQQILSVAPILPGQTSQSQSGTQPSQSQPSTQPPQSQQHYAAPPAQSNDLIDFGQSSNSSAPLSGPIQPQHQQQHPQAQAPLLDFQDQLEPGHPVKRVDTYTSDLDEFVDAKS